MKRGRENSFVKSRTNRFSLMGNLILGVLVIVIGGFPFGSAVTMLQRPYTVGENDSPIHVDFRLYEGGTPWNMTAECVWVPFETNGHDICLYGYVQVYEEGKAIDFFFTDQVGYNEIVNTGQTLRTRFWNQTTSMDWNVILPHRYNGLNVEKWYAFVSFSGITDIFLPERTGTLFIGQDLTPPKVSIDLNSEVSGTGSFTVTFTESNCNLSEYRVSIQGEILEEDSFQPGRKTATKSFAFDSTKYPEGECIISVWVCDTGRAGQYYYAHTTVNNVPDESTSSPTTSPIGDSDYLADMWMVFLGIFCVAVTNATNNVIDWLWWLGFLLAIANVILRLLKARWKVMGFPWIATAVLSFWVGIALFLWNIVLLYVVALPVFAFMFSALEVGGIWKERRDSAKQEKKESQKELQEKKQNGARDKRIARLEEELARKNLQIRELGDQSEKLAERVETLEREKGNDGMDSRSSG